jgi:folate-binding protein YgfZ
MNDGITRLSESILLADRSVLRVAGPQSESFLQDLVSNDVTTLGTGEARYAALLTPQGKILFDMLIIAIEQDGARAFLLDCASEQAAELVKRLGFYKLRAKVTIEDRSDAIAVLACLDALPQDIDAIAVRDPRAPSLGWRAYVPRQAAASAQPHVEAYDARRIAAGVPKGGIDFFYGDALPHEANLDRLGGVDFKKGCYIGQEVVSRMEHRGTTRKRVVRIRFPGVPPAPGAEIRAGDVLLGTVGSSAGKQGLAMVRLDRAADAKSAGVAPVASGVALDVEI